MSEFASNNSDVEQECVRLAVAGFTRAQIAGRLGISHFEVKDILSRHGVKAGAPDLSRLLLKPSADPSVGGRKITAPKSAKSRRMSKRLREIALAYVANANDEKGSDSLETHDALFTLKSGVGVSVLWGKSEVGIDLYNNTVVYPLEEIYTLEGGVYISEDARNLEYSEKLRVLDEFAATHPGRPVSKLVAELFPNPHVEIDADENERITLPTVAPALWSEEKNRRETPPDFIKRVYAPWIGNGIARQHIRHLDRKLYQALATWIRRNGQIDFDLPTNVEVTDRWIDRVRSGAAPATSVREINRLSSALQRREKTGRS